MPPPTKEQRDNCWAARDAYFNCLDINGMWLDGVKPASMEEILSLEVASTSSVFDRINSKATAAGKECALLRQAWESKCLSSWQQHFLTERIKEKQKRYLQEKMVREEMERNKEASDFWDRVKKEKQ